MIKDDRERSEYFKEYNAKRKQSQADYYRGYSAKPANKLRRHNRYERLKVTQELEDALNAAIMEIEVDFEIVKIHYKGR